MGTKKFLVVGILAILATVPQALNAENKTDKDRIFSDPPTGDWVQVLLGLTDVGLASALLKDKVAAAADPRVIALKSAEKELEAARNLLTAEEKASMVKELRETLTQVSEHEENALGSTEAAAEALTDASKLKTVASSAEKAEAIQKATTAVSRAREDLLLNATKGKGPGLFGKGVKAVKRVGAAIFIVDVLGRIYVWHALDANPTFTPVGTVAAHYGKKIFAEVKAKGGVGNYLEHFDGHQ